MSRPFTCDECRAAFAPADGGACAACGRVLCGRHLRGWRPRALELFARTPPRCPACRRAADRRGDDWR